MAKLPSKKVSSKSAPTKLVVGATPWIDWALAEWANKEPAIKLIRIELPQDTSYDFNFESLKDHDPKKASAFIAFGESFLNLRRQELYMKMKLLGFSLPPLIEPQVMIATDVTVAENVWIKRGAIIGNGNKIDIGAHIGIAAVVQAGCNLGEHITLHDGARIGSHCKLGMFATIGGQVVLADSTELAPFSRLMKRGVYQGVHKDAIFIEDCFEARILS